MDDTVDDGRLIEASWSEPKRFADLFDRHYDLAGETFCRAFECRRRFDVSRSDARPWLYGIALNLVRTHHRGRFRRRNAYERDASFAATNVDFPSVVEQTVDARRELAAVMDALLRLPEDDVDVLLLHIWGSSATGRSPKRSPFP
jgi:RNA polymerase sigma factor (sigma-70 family)